MSNYKRDTENTKPIKKTNSVRQTYIERMKLLKKLKDILEKMKTSDPNYTKLYNHIQKLENNLNKMRMRIAAVVLTGAIAIGSILGGVAGIIAHQSDKNLNKNLQNATDIVEMQDGVIGIDGSASQKDYEDYKDKLLKYSKLLDLKNTDSLTWEQKKEMSDLKDYIKKHPEELNNLALEIVKTKIAEKINLDDPGKVHTYFYTNGIVNNVGITGNITEVSITVQENENDPQLTPVASYEDFTSVNTPSGGNSPDYGDISVELFNTLAQIAANQGKDKLGLGDAKKALKLALELDSKSIISTNKDFSKDNIITAGGKEFVIE